MRAAVKKTRLIGALLPLMLFGCAHLWAPNAAGPRREDAAHAWVGRTLALRHSHFFGDMYEDNERILLSPHAFSTLYHRVDLQGAPIHPNPADGILAAGSHVRVESVEFPGPLAYLRRMLNAPTAHVWVRLRLAGPSRADIVATVGARPLIAVLEGATNTAAELDAAMADLFGDTAATQAWLDARRPRVRAAIAHKQVLRGMSQAELVAAQGEPWQWLAQEPGADAAGSASKIAWYPDQEIWLVGDEIVDIRRARRLP